MGYKYTSLEDGQVIVSDHPVDYLEGLARWVRTEDSDAVEPKSDDAGVAESDTDDTRSAKPERPNANDPKQDWVDYAKALGHTDDELHGLTTAKIKDLVG